MCTVTWLREDGAYRLYCNRDERKSRSIAFRPQVHRSPAQTLYLSPRDPDHGGTWLATNEHGLAISVLNANGRNPNASRSRGLLPPELIDATDAEAALRHLQGMRLDQYQPFTLAALDLHSAAAIAHWDGSSLEIRYDQARLGLLTSSSLSDNTARERRAALLADFDGDSLPAFHRSHADGDLRFSPCMHRDDASTVSFSAITCRQGELQFHYTPGPPCLAQAGETWSLPCTSKS
jgi:uncharacterized protein with NRDE domain